MKPSFNCLTFPREGREKSSKRFRQRHLLYFCVTPPESDAAIPIIRSFFAAELLYLFREIYSKSLAVMKLVQVNKWVSMKQT